MSTKRIAITGMAVNTPLGDSLDEFLKALLAGRSAITKWKAFDCSGIYSKIGGDLIGYDIEAKTAALASRLPPNVHMRMRRLLTRVAWSTRLSVLCAADAWLDAGIDGSDLEPTRIGVIVAGHNLNSYYVQQNVHEFRTTSSI